MAERLFKRKKKRNTKFPNFISKPYNFPKASKIPEEYVIGFFDRDKRELKENDDGFPMKVILYKEKEAIVKLMNIRDLASFEEKEEEDNSTNTLTLTMNDFGPREREFLLAKDPGSGPSRDRVRSVIEIICKKLNKSLHLSTSPRTTIPRYGCEGFSVRGISLFTEEQDNDISLPFIAVNQQDLAEKPSSLSPPAKKKLPVPVSPTKQTNVSFGKRCD